VDGSVTGSRMLMVTILSTAKGKINVHSLLESGVLIGLEALTGRANLSEEKIEGTSGGSFSE